MIIIEWGKLQMYVKETLMLDDFCVVDTNILHNKDLYVCNRCQDTLNLERFHHDQVHRNQNREALTISIE